MESALNFVALDKTCIARQFWKSQLYSDLILQTDHQNGKHAFEVHKCVVSPLSSLLTSLFNDVSTVDAHNSDEVLLLQNTTVTTLKLFIQLLYTGHVICNSQWQLDQLNDLIRILQFDRLTVSVTMETVGVVDRSSSDSCNDDNNIVTKCELDDETSSPVVTSTVDEEMGCCDKEELASDDDGNDRGPCLNDVSFLCADQAANDRLMSMTDIKVLNESHMNRNNVESTDTHRSHVVEKPTQRENGPTKSLRRQRLNQKFKSNQFGSSTGMSAVTDGNGRHLGFKKNLITKDSVMEVSLKLCDPSRPLYCRECEKQLKGSFEFDHHLVVHLGIRDFVCSVCQKEFFAKSELKKHVQATHEANDLKCPHCDSKFSVRVRLNRHIKQNHSSHDRYKYRCDVCEKKFVTSTSLRTHEQCHENTTPVDETSGSGVDTSSHTAETKEAVLREIREKMSDPEQPNVCTGCNMNLKNPTLFTRHLIQHLGFRDFKCDKCGNTFYTQSELNRHHIMQHADDKRRHVCSVCEKRFVVRSLLMKHMEKHQTTGVQCKFCDQSFSKITHLRRHIKGTHQRYSCDHNKCLGKFNSLQDLERHKQIHIPWQPKPCVHCGLIFKWRITYEKHLLEHQGAEKKFVCDKDGCGKSFHVKYELKKHIICTHLEKSILCNYCALRFATNGQVNAHIKKSHSGQQSCEVCGEAQKNALHLQRHLKSHEGPKRFACDRCKKKFYLQQDLDQHVKKHEKRDTNPEPRFQCPLCEKMYASKQLVDRHMKVHDDLKPFSGVDLLHQHNNNINHDRSRGGKVSSVVKEHQCLHCPKSFAAKINLTRHTKLHFKDK